MSKPLHRNATAAGAWTKRCRFAADWRSNRGLRSWRLRAPEGALTR